jgi:hypothetical protein
MLGSRQQKQQLNGASNLRWQPDSRQQQQQQQAGGRW